MASKYWISNVTAAWDTGAAWSGGVKPGASDDAIFTGDFTGSVTAPAGVETVDNVYVAEGYTGLMGTSGAPLTVDCTVLAFEGMGAAYWDGQYNQVRLSSKNLSNDAVFVDRNTVVDPAAYTSVTRGFAKLAGSHAATVFSKHADGSEPVVVVDPSTSLTGVMTVEAGRITLNENASDTFVTGGQVTMNDVTVGGKIDVSGGSVVYVGSDATASLAMSAIAVSKSGVLDASQMKGDFAMSGIVLAGAGGFINLDSGKPFTVTASVLQAAGGRIKYFGDNVNPIQI